MLPEYYVFVFLFAIGSAVSQETTVQLPLGHVTGTLQTFQGKPVNTYLGIPFAQPPVGQLRFQKPLPLTRAYGNWSATKWPNSCIQKSPYVTLLKYQSVVFSEDCLYLNIWSPRSESPEVRKPVMVYIYGGAFYMGSSSEEVLNALPLSALGDIVVVTFNYRLGALGFLYGGTDQLPGNLAFYDQILALEWVQQNIGAFGGDPNKVTISGESAGSISVGTLLLSPMAEHLFSGAILMSGSPLNPEMVENRSDALNKAKTFASSINCLIGDTDESKMSADSIQCLKSADADVIIKKQSDLESSTMSWMGLFEDDILPMSPSKALENNQFKHSVPILVGTVTYEGSIVEMDMSKYDFLIPILSNGTKQQWIEALAMKIASSSLNMSESMKIANYYYDPIIDDATINRKTFAHAMADYFLACPTRLQGKLMSSHNQVNSYVFSYKATSRGSRNGYNLVCEPEDPVCHATELQFLFGMPFLKSDFDETDRKVSLEMINIFSGFVRDGQAPWRPFYDVSGITVPVTYEINPHKDNRIINDYKYVECSLWAPYLI
ncbi:Acetylcholinesterase-1 [Halotydeus destructor]|nr:Acetylcholinesterase-1 [Halotydeus destructor]